MRGAWVRLGAAFNEVAMQRILVAVDGSESSMRAARHAAELCKRLGDCSILLLNVQDPIEEMQTHGLAREAIAAHRDSLAQSTAAEARAALDRAGVRHSFEWRYGDPARAIVDAARAGGCEAIVMGTRGAGPIENLLVGSVAYKVLHIADVPVTLVK
jgi:nucleotide-binding universal stress UspA family protein